MTTYINNVLDIVKNKDGNEKEFIQAVEEVLKSVKRPLKRMATIIKTINAITG